MIETQKSLGEEQIGEIKRAFKTLIEGTDPKDQKSILEAASAKAEISLEDPDGPISEECASLVVDICRDARRWTAKDDKLIIALAGLDYFVDEWDVIPDFIPEEGLIDDLYILKNARAILKGDRQPEELGLDLQIGGGGRDGEESGHHFFITELHGAAGMHFAGRAKRLDLLSKYERKGLYDIGMRIVRGWDITLKQESFYVGLIDNLIEEGLLDTECEKSPCKYCSQLERLLQ